MSIKSKHVNPRIQFVVQGLKTILTYTYILLVDADGQTLIERIASDQSTILHSKKPDTISVSDFWNGDIENYEYKYIYQL